MSWQPLLIDELDFIVAARDWPMHGSIVPHPPGYVHLLRLLFGLFGESQMLARLPGLGSALLALWLLPVFVRRAFPDHPDRTGLSILSAWLFALAPLTVQSAMLVDIDTSVMIPMILVLFLLWFPGGGGDGRARIIKLGLALCIAFWLKLPPPLLFVAGVAIAALWTRDREGLRVLGAATLLGAVLFVSTFAAHAMWTGFGVADLMGTFVKLSFLVQWKRILVTVPQTTGVFVMWLTVPAAILLALAVVREFCRSRGEESGAGAAIAAFVLVAAGFYSYSNPPAYGFPKYQAILIPFVSVLIARLVWSAWLRPPGRTGAVLVLVGVAAMAVHFLLGDPMYDFYRVTEETSAGELGRRIAAAGRAVGVAALPTLVTVPVLIVAARLKPLRLRELTLLVLAAAAGGQMVAVLNTQARAVYSTRYHYGSDFGAYLDVCHRIEESLEPDSFVIAPKSVLYRTGRPGRFVAELVRPDLKPDTLLAVMSRRKVEALVFSSRERSRARATLEDPAVADSLNRAFVSSQVGEYLVYLRKP